MAKTNQPACSGRAIEDFRRAHDKRFSVRQNIEDALAKLGDGWLYERELGKSAGVSTNDMATARELFSDHLVTVIKNGKKKVVWTGTKKLAKKLRAMVGV